MEHFFLWISDQFWVTGVPLIAVSNKSYKYLALRILKQSFVAGVPLTVDSNAH